MPYSEGEEEEGGEEEGRVESGRVCISFWHVFTQLFTVLKDTKSTFRNVIDTIIEDHTSPDYADIVGLIDESIGGYFDPTKKLSELIDEETLDIVKGVIEQMYQYLDMTVSDVFPKSRDIIEDINSFLRYKCTNDKTLELTKALDTSIHTILDFAWDITKLFGIKKDNLFFKIVDDIIDAVFHEITKKEFKPLDAAEELPLVGDLCEMAGSIIKSYANNKDMTVRKALEDVDTKPLTIVGTIENLKKLDLSKCIMQDIINCFVIGKTKSGMFRTILNVPQVYNNLKGFNKDTKIKSVLDAVAFPYTSEFYDLCNFGAVYFDEDKSSFTTKEIAKNLPGEFASKLVDAASIVMKSLATNSFTMSDCNDLVSSIQNADAAAIDTINGGKIKSSGFPTWGIVLIVILCVAVIGGIIVALFLKRKKKEDSSAFQKFEV